MTPPMIDLTNREAVRHELLDEDAAVRADFAAHLEAELGELADGLVACFRLLPALNEAANQAQTTRAALVAGFAYGVLDDLLTSTKLLFAGKLLASGNLMRQAVEGIAISFLCSTDALLIIETKKKRPVMARYWEKLESGDPRTHGHHALRQLRWNAATLAVGADAVERLRVAVDRYNGFSHCGPFAIANRVSLDGLGTVYAGGHFDPAKLEGYRFEMNERIGLCRALPTFMERLLETMRRPVRPAAPAQQAEQA